MQQHTAGNSSADSDIRFGGIDPETRFTSFSLLYATLPPRLVELGDHAPTVHAPSNGNAQIEKKCQDQNVDSVLDA